MKRLAFFLLLIALTACGAETSPQIITEAPTVTPANFVTPTPSITPAPVVAIANTSTPVPTSTRAVQQNASDGAVATSPLRPTFTPLPPTSTVTAAPTQLGLRIDYFTTISQAIAPGENVTLTWRVFGADDITIYRVDEDGDYEREWPVEREGRLTVSTSPQRTDGAEFIMIASAGSTLVEDRLFIEVTCNAQWFFSPPPSACSTNPPENSLQVEQSFEGGRMIWVAATSEIYTFFNDSEQPRWIKLADNFTEEMPERDDSIVPPEGRLQPVRGFGLIWRTNQRIRDRLGWALQPEAAYDGVIQSADNGDTVYMRTLDGGIIGLTSGGRDWELIPAAPQ